MKIKDLKKQVNSYTNSNFDIPHQYEEIKDYAYAKEFEAKPKKRFNLKVFAPTFALSMVSIIVLFIILFPSMTNHKYYDAPSSDGDTEYASEYTNKPDASVLEPAHSLESNVNSEEIEYHNSTYIYLTSTLTTDISDIVINNKPLTSYAKINEITKVDSYYVIYWFSDGIQNVLYSNNTTEEDFITVYNDLINH